MKKIAFTVMLAVCVLTAAACGDKAPEDAARIYEDIYAENTMYTLDEKQQIIERFEETGLSAVDSSNRINMVNWEPVDEFCGSGEGGCRFYVINDDGSYTQYDLTAAGAKLDVNMKVCSGGEDSAVTYQNEYEAASWKYTDKGYLFFGAEHQTGDFEPWLETAVRVKPMDEQLHQATEKYMMVLGYEDNDLFIENWSEDDYSDVDLYDLYEVLTGNITAEEEKIPAAGFEAVLQQYLEISQEEIRSRTDYDAADDSYIFSSRTREAMGSTPDMPYPEVAGITENNDGTLVLNVEAVWPKYKEDRAFVHEVTVRPAADGTFKYISNSVIEKPLGTAWYVER